MLGMLIVVKVVFARRWVFAILKVRGGGKSRLYIPRALWKIGGKGWDLQATSEAQPSEML